MNSPEIISNHLKQGKETIISYYENIAGKGESEIRFSDLFSIIKRGGDYFDIIEKLRSETNTQSQDNLKKKLPLVTPSGLFNGKRKLENLSRYSGFICLDFDNVSDIINTKNLLKLDPYCYAIFISPSGKGLKLFVKVECNKDSHKKTYNSLCDYFAKKYAVEADRSCKDITRSMFLSYDPELIVTENSEVWNKDKYQLFLIERMLKQLGEKESFIEGNRNNFIFKLSSSCCRRSIQKYNCEKFILERFESVDFKKNEILITINSAYNSAGNRPLNEPNDEKTENHSLFARVEKYIGDRYDIRFNVVNTKVEFRISGSENPFTELNEDSLFRELQLANLNFPINKLTSLLKSDFVPYYNPFKEYFDNLGTWNQEGEEDYILKLADYLPVKDKERFKTQFKKMLVRCIACSLDDNIFNKQVLVLVQDLQNSGKSTFCRWLCPPALKDYLAENINTDKDSLIAMATNFIINMDELATLSKNEINALKSFISKDKINIRLPFGKRATTMPRRANFVGSTNKDEFLTDETGSVRWLCFALGGMINFRYMEEVNIDDVWKQAYSLYISGFKYQMTPEEIVENESANTVFQVNSTEMELIPKHYSYQPKEKGGVFVTATDILNNLYRIYPHLRFSPILIGKALKLLGYEKIQEYKKGRKLSLRGYYVEEIVINLT